MNRLLSSVLFLTLSFSSAAFAADAEKQLTPEGNLLSEQFSTSSGAVVQNVYDGTVPAQGAQDMDRAVTFYREDGELDRRVYFKNYEFDRVENFDIDGEVESVKTRAEFDAEEKEFISGRKNGSFRTFDGIGQWIERVYENGKVKETRAVS